MWNFIIVARIRITLKGRDKRFYKGKKCLKMREKYKKCVKRSNVIRIQKSPNARSNRRSKMFSLPFFVTHADEIQKAIVAPPSVESRNSGGRQILI